MIYQWYRITLVSNTMHDVFSVQYNILRRQNIFCYHSSLLTFICTSINASVISKLSLCQMFLNAVTIQQKLESWNPINSYWYFIYLNFLVICTQLGQLNFQRNFLTFGIDMFITMSVTAYNITSGPITAFMLCIVLVCVGLLTCIEGIPIKVSLICYLIYGLVMFLVGRMKCKIIQYILFTK